MCLILFAWQAHPRYALVLGANGEEGHARPTAAAEFAVPVMLDLKYTLKSLYGRTTSRRMERRNDHA